MNRMLRRKPLVSLACLLALAGCHHAHKSAVRVIAAPPPAASSALAVESGLPADFEPSTWRFLHIDGEHPLADSSGDAPTLSFLQGTLGGSTGCNRILADYQRHGNAITLGAPALTRRFCDGKMAFEAKVADALSRTRFLVLIQSTGLLGLADGDHKLIAELERVPETAAP